MWTLNKVVPKFALVHEVALGLFPIT